MALYLPYLSTLPTPSTPDSSIPLSTIPISPLNWLWPQHIPLGKLTLLDGAPGSGTSLLALTIAAAVTSGLPLPGSNDPSFSPVQGSVILISPHDHAGDTIRPRLEAAGGDASFLFLLNSISNTEADPATSSPSSSTSSLPKLPVNQHSFSLVEDLDALESTIIRRHARLVIIDPLHTALAPSSPTSGSPGSSGSRSSHRPSQRALLFSLAQLARRTHCAILLVRQVNTRSSLLHRPRPSASPDLVSAARSGLLLTTDPTDEQTSLLVPTKSPLCAPSPILAYQVMKDEHSTPHIHWPGAYHPSRAAASALSAHRQAILQLLQDSPTSLVASEVASRIDRNEEGVRKMLLRMRQDGELLSPSRGHYTTHNHPCLAALNSPPSNPIPEIRRATLTNLGTLEKTIIEIPSPPTLTNHKHNVPYGPTSTNHMPGVASIPSPASDTPGAASALTPANHMPGVASVPTATNHQHAIANVPFPANNKQTVLSVPNTTLYRHTVASFPNLEKLVHDVLSISPHEKLIRDALNAPTSSSPRK